MSPSGRYRGKYQFLRSTWKEWGGRGDDPAEASEAHQDRVALRLYRARGTDAVAKLRRLKQLEPLPPYAAARARGRRGMARTTRVTEQSTASPA